MKLTLVIYSLHSGGAERVMSIAANYWVNQGWQVTLLTFVDPTEIAFYELDSRVNYIPLGIAKMSSNSIRAITNNWQSIKRLREAIVNSDPELIISFLNITNVTTLLATLGAKIPVIVSERNDPNNSPNSKIWRALRKLSYQFADAIVVQTNRAFNYFPPQLQSNITIIANPVILPTANCNSSPKSSSQPSIIAMGRLESQKGFDLLLKAFAQLKDTYSNWTLTILGEGTKRSQLENLREQLGLSDRVYFPGRVKNPNQWLKQADIFVMSSRFEGFPNALCEAMACGLPVISTDCPNGPREIIRDGIDGILVANESVSALKEAIESLMVNESKRQLLGKRALEITTRFSLLAVMNQWEKVIEKVKK